MPTQLLLRLNWGQIYPDFRDKCFELAARCRKRGFDYYATSGFRSPEEQLVLWQKGRDAEGAVVDPKSVVTKVKFGLHNAGLAVDWALDADLDKAGLQPSWDGPKYKVLAEEAEALGLEAGYNWKTFQDPPHVQVPIGKLGITITMLKGLVAQGGLPAAWGLVAKNWT